MPLSEKVKEIISKTIENGFRVLDLRNNQIGKEEVTALAAELKQMPSLTSLYLRGNFIGDEGAKALAACLPGANITHLDFIIGGNNIGDEGDKALDKALTANRKRIKNEVMEFKDKFLSINNEFKDLKDIGLNIKLGFIKLLHKFGKYAFAKHIKEFLKLDEEECTIVNKLDETAASIKAEIVRKIPGINNNNIAANIAKFLDIKDCLELNAIKSAPHHNSSTEEAEHGAHAATLLTRGGGSQLDGPAEEPDFLSAGEVVDGSQPYPTQNTNLLGEISAGFVSDGLES